MTSTINALAPWFGSNRLLASEAGKLLSGREWVGIPFAGSLSEVLHIDARAIVVSDVHWQIINLAATAAHPKHGPELYRRLKRAIFHSLTLSENQALSSLDERIKKDSIPNIDVATSYFISVWMNRSALAGTDGEFKGGLPVRWSATGGDSAVRYQTAVRSLLKWREALKRCNFVCLDFREFLAKCKDEPRHAIYVDSPWPSDGEKYKHKFSDADHRDLARLLAQFKQARVVVRFGDHPFVRELYPEDQWTWQSLDGRTQANHKKAEVLLVRN